MDRSSARLPRPRDVAGFEAARAQGRTPLRPSAPPRIVEGTTARQAFRHLVIVHAVAVAAIIGCLILLPDNRIAGKYALAFFAVLTVAYVVLRASLRRFRAIFLDELQAGYTTQRFMQGLFWLPRKGGGLKPPVDDVVGWDWSGVWVYDSDGNVVSAPDVSVDPPGLYPSPHIAGTRELWTGYRWTGVYPEG